MHLKERTEGGSADGAITIEINHAAAASIWDTLHTNIRSRSWVLGQTTGGHHSIHGGQTKKRSCNRGWGVTGGRIASLVHD
jgi:hypothetical protein